MSVPDLVFLAIAIPVVVLAFIAPMLVVAGRRIGLVKTGYGEQS